MPKKKRTPNTVQASEITLEVLTGLKELNGAGVTELANYLDRSKSQIYNYLATLKQEEFVVQEGNTYDLGLRFAGIGTYVRSKKEIYAISKPQIDKLAEETGDLVNLLVEEHGRGIYLYSAKGDNAVNVDTDIGHRVYLHNTALGKAILAELDPEEVEQIVEKQGLPQATDETITDYDTLRNELDRIEERGVAFDREERLPGLRCVASAVTDNEGTVHGAISISGPASRMQDTRFQEELPEKLEEVANVVSLNMSYS